MSSASPSSRGLRHLSVSDLQFDRSLRCWLDSRNLANTSSKDPGEVRLEALRVSDPLVSARLSESDEHQEVILLKAVTIPYF